MIYFDNAATSFHKPKEVAEAVYDAILTMGNASRGVHDAALSSMHVLYDTRCMLAQLFHADGPEQVAFTSNSTEALNIAIQGTLQAGDHVITTCLEHNSVLRPLYLMQERGVGLSILSADKDGNVLYEQLPELLKSNTKAIVCTHASNLTGNLVDIQRIGDFCNQHGLLLIVDASQSAGIFPIDMQAMHISILCFTGHKALMGPQGTGGICVQKDVEVRPLKVGGSGIHSFMKEQPKEMPTRLESGTLNAHGLAGLHAALKWLQNQDMQALRKKEQKLTQMFYEGVCNLPDIRLYGDFSSFERAPIVTLNLGDYGSGEVSDELQQRFDIATRSGAHCAPLMHEHLGTVGQGAVRFSFSHFNTEEEVQEGIRAMTILATE
jgi:cysteine desulfurase family protein